MVGKAKMKEAAGNSCTAMMQKKRTRFNSISGFKGCHNAYSNDAKEEDTFQFNLRIQGVPQDAIYRDTDRMTRIHSLVHKLQAGYDTKSIIFDLKKKGTSNVFSEASRRTIKEQGFFELYELKEMSKTCSVHNVHEISKRRNEFLSHVE